MGARRPVFPDPAEEARHRAHTQLCNRCSTLARPKDGEAEKRTLALCSRRAESGMLEYFDHATLAISGYIGPAASSSRKLVLECVLRLWLPKASRAWGGVSYNN